MGFLDSVSETLSRGVAATGRTTRIMRLKSQIAETQRRREQLATQLGESLYEVTFDNPLLRAGREDLYDGIAECDQLRHEFQQQIDDIEAEARAAEARAAEARAAEASAMLGGPECPRCHSHAVEGDLFCRICGSPLSQPYAASPDPMQRRCPACGSAVAMRDRFCTICGQRLPEVVYPEPRDAVASQPHPTESQYGHAVAVPTADASPENMPFRQEEGFEAQTGFGAEVPREYVGTGVRDAYEGYPSDDYEDAEADYPEEDAGYLDNAGYPNAEGYAEHDDYAGEEDYAAADDYPSPEDYPADEDYPEDEPDDYAGADDDQRYAPVNADQQR